MSFHTSNLQAEGLRCELIVMPLGWVSGRDIRKQRLYENQYSENTLLRMWARKQKFVVGNYYKWEMVDNKDIKLQINEYYKLLEELRVEKIELLE